MSYFEIVAHRGVPTELPENTLPSFERAVELGADVIELDVRLTRDRVPIVYHYFYLDEATTGAGPVFQFTFDQIAVSAIRSHGIEVHAWDVNDAGSLRRVAELGIPRIDTDELQQALDFRRQIA